MLNKQTTTTTIVWQQAKSDLSQLWVLSKRNVNLCVRSISLQDLEREITVGCFSYNQAIDLPAVQKHLSLYVAGPRRNLVPFLFYGPYPWRLKSCTAAQLHLFSGAMDQLLTVNLPTERRFYFYFFKQMTKTSNALHLTGAQDAVQILHCTDNSKDKQLKC